MTNMKTNVKLVYICSYENEKNRHCFVINVSCSNTKRIFDKKLEEMTLTLNRRSERKSRESRRKSTSRRKLDNYFSKQNCMIFRKKIKKKRKKGKVLQAVFNLVSKVHVISESARFVALDTFDSLEFLWFFIFLMTLTCHKAE